VDLEVIRDFLQAKVLLILVLLFKTVLLLSLIFEIAERRSCLWVAATTHAYGRGVIVILRCSPKRFLKVGHSIPSIVNRVILVFVGRQLLIRNFLLVLHLFKRLLG
jgi:hypothetical protein